MRPAGGAPSGSSGAAGDRPPAPAAKTTVAELGIDPDGLDWERSGDGDGVMEIAFVADAGGAAADAADGSIWVLMRMTGDPAGRILVYDRHEWECFLDGVRNGEFDDAASPSSS